MRSIVILIVAVLAYVSIILTSNPDLPLAAPMTAQKVLDTCRTGDLLFFVSKAVSKTFLAVSPVTHVSLIVRDAHGRPYSVETHKTSSSPPGYNGDGVQVYPLEVRLAQNGITTDLSYVRLMGPAASTEARDAMIAALPTLRKRYKYKYTFVRDEFVCRVTNGRDDISETMHCANFTSLLLQMLGVARADQRIDCIRPVDVAWLKLTDGREYASKAPLSDRLAAVTVTSKIGVL
jgi:hypothetical protein